LQLVVRKVRLIDGRWDEKYAYDASVHLQSAEPHAMLTGAWHEPEVQLQLVKDN
jgi:hypothetical protein